MLPTPSTSHVNYDRVYEPAEDSYVLLDTLSSETETSFLKSRFPSDTAVPIVAEVGTGSGVVLAFLTAHAEHILGRSDILAVGVDVNEFAVKAATGTISSATAELLSVGGSPGLFADCVVGDLATAIKPGSLDVLIFNPPYVPTESLPDPLRDMDDEDTREPFARDSHMLSLSTDGGIEGMEVTNRLFAQIPKVLSVRGVAYILLCAGNKPQEVVQAIRSWPSEPDQSWKVAKVGTSGKKAGWEKLCVIRIFR